MLATGDFRSSSAILAVAVGLCSIILGLWLYYDRRVRNRSACESDLGHFRRQDRRRVVVVLMMAVAAGGIAWGGGVDHRQGPRLNPLFAAIWLTVSAVVVVLLVLALVDWMATWRYARLVRMRLVRERLKIVREMLSSSPHPPAQDADQKSD